jgi:hypothetical protein
MKGAEVKAASVPAWGIPQPGIPPPPLGRALTEEEKAENIRKAKEQTERLKEQFELGITAALKKRADAGIGDDGNAITPEDLKEAELQM